MEPRLRRALHFVPGGRDELLQKSLTLPADSLILDLEDAVAPEGKEAARIRVTEWLEQCDFGGRERVVRINPLQSDWGLLDLEATVAARPDAYLVPKVSGPDDLRAIDAVLTRLEREHGHPEGAIRLLVLATETPQGLLSIRELAGCPRVDGLTWGLEDLAAALGASRSRDEAGEYLEVFRYARVMTLLAAVAAGVQPIDTVYVDFRDTEGLRRESRAAAWMGFTGKLTIHPLQVEVVNQVFTPNAAEIEESRELVAAFEEQQGSGIGAFRFRGRMVDAAHLSRARAVLERARRAGLV